MKPEGGYYGSKLKLCDKKVIKNEEKTCNYDAREVARKVDLKRILRTYYCKTYERSYISVSYRLVVLVQ